MNFKALLTSVVCVTLSSSALAIPEITSKTALEDLIKDNNVVLDYYLPWCGPCKAMAPILDKMPAKFKDVEFAKINFDAHDDLGNPKTITALKSGITAAPTLIFIKKGGKEVDRHVGKMSETDLIAKVKSVFCL